MARLHMRDDNYIAAEEVLQRGGAECRGCRSLLSVVYYESGKFNLKEENWELAAADFKRSVELLQARSNFVQRTLWVKLARAHALDGKAKSSYEALRDARLAPSYLRSLREDPDFAILAEHSRYSGIFE